LITFDPTTGVFHRFATGSDAGAGCARSIHPGRRAGAGIVRETRRRMLVGNFGSGTIMSFDADGKFRGLSRGQVVMRVTIEVYGRLRL